MKAKSDSKLEKEVWCMNYIRQLRQITNRKFNEITSYFAIVKKKKTSDSIKQIAILRIKPNKLI